MSYSHLKAPTFDLKIDMQKLLSKYQIVVLSNPYEMIENIEMWNYLRQISIFKVRGYQKQYPHGVLPIDASDFFSLHFIVCQKTLAGLKPVTSLKVALLSRCEKHQATFPGVGLAQAAESPLHVKAMQKIVQHCLTEKKELSYASSWTIDPTLRENKETIQDLRDLFGVIYINGNRHYNVDQITVGGTVRFKTDELFLRWGHNPIVDDDKNVLPIIQVKHLFKERVQIMHLQKYSEYALQYEKAFKEIWDAHIEIASNEISNAGLIKSAS